MTMNSRRTFIKQTGLAAASVLLAPSLAFKAPKRVGIQLYTLREELPKDVNGVRLTDIRQKAAFGG